jgi:transcriptional regulator with XRE-family HTH domain
MNTINERIELLIKQLNLNNNSFSKRIGLTSSTTIGNIVGGRKNEPSFELLRKIITSFEQLNITWLMTGKGEMFVNNEQIVQEFENKLETIKEFKENYSKCINCEHKQELIEALTERIEDLKELVKSKDETIDLLKGGKI